MTITTFFDLKDKVYVRDWNAKDDEPQYMKGEIFRMNICGNSEGGYEILYHVGIWDAQSEAWYYADIWENALIGMNSEGENDA